MGSRSKRSKAPACTNRDPLCATSPNQGIFYSRGGIPTSFASIIGRFEREYDQADRLVDEITHGGTTIEARGAAAIAKLEAEHREVVSAHATPAAMFLASIGKGVCRRRGRRRAAGGGSGSQGIHGMAPGQAAPSRRRVSMSTFA